VTLITWENKENTLYYKHKYTDVLCPKRFLVFSGFFGDRKAQIAELADQAARGIVDFYDSLAVKSVNDAIMKVNDLFIALYVIEKINPNADGKNECSDYSTNSFPDSLSSASLDDQWRQSRESLGTTLLTLHLACSWRP